MIDHTDQFSTELDLRLPVARKPAFSEVCFYGGRDFEAEFRDRT